MSHLLESAKIIPTMIVGPFVVYDSGLIEHCYSIYRKTGYGYAFIASGMTLNNACYLVNMTNFALTHIDT